MPVHTKLEIWNEEKRIKNPYLTKRFTSTTTIADIEVFIMKKCKNHKPPFDLTILDQGGDYVTLDEDYLEEYIPFNIEASTTTTVQPINLPDKTVTIRVILTDRNRRSSTDQLQTTVPRETSEAIIQQTDVTQQTADTVSVQEQLQAPSIELAEDPKMGFVSSCNVNTIQRDQYICDAKNMDTGVITGKLSRLQGEKNSTNNYTSILPKFKIGYDGIKNRPNSIWTLLVFIVLDVYEKGERLLYCHPQRIFVEKDNITQRLNPYEIPILAVNGMENIELLLKLFLVVIEGTKKHSYLPANILCRLENSNENESFISQHNGNKTRLALVLREDNYIHWETLVLSNEMNFIKKNKPCNITNILNVPTDTGIKSLKRTRATKSQTTKNQQNKRRKSNRVANLPTNNNDTSTASNQNLPTYYDNSEGQLVTSGPLSNVPDVGSELELDSTLLEDLFQNQSNMINILPTYLDVTLMVNTPTDPLINADPSLHTDTSLTNSPYDNN